MSMRDNTVTAEMKQEYSQKLEHNDYAFGSGVRYDYLNAVTDEPYVTKDSGERELLGSGAVRDVQTGKPRYDCIPTGPLKRLAELYARGAEKYSDFNWHKGMPTQRAMASMLRHAEAYRGGDRSEDHLAAVCWNAMAIMEFENTEYDDAHDWNTHD